MLQPSPVPAIAFAERLRTGAGSRALGIGLALLVEGLLLLLLLSLNAGDMMGVKEGKRITVVNLSAEAVSEAAPEPNPAEREQPAQERPAPQRPATEEPPPRSTEPKPVPVPMIKTPLPQPRAAIPASPARPAPPRRVYGPPDRGGSSASRDTERVGTAPNGEPLYAAAWYREPKEDELRGYMSTARGPGWGLIACRTVPDYRVGDCVALAEYPEGSQINRAVLAAAWQFRVRPPRLGGQPQVGSWVRIRIDYGIEGR